MSLVLNIARDDFLSGLVSVQNITSKKGTMAILSNVLIQSENDAVILTATDLEIGIKKKLPAEILSSGSITLPARKLFEIVRESNSDQIHMEILENSWAKINDDSSNYRLAGMDSEEFPSFPEYQEEMLVPVPGEILHDLINKTIFSVAQDSESQFTLTAILVEKEKKDGKNFLNFVSSDGHRLSLMDKSNKCCMYVLYYAQKNNIKEVETSAYPEYSKVRSKLAGFLKIPVENLMMNFKCILPKPAILIMGQIRR